MTHGPVLSLETALSDADIRALDRWETAIRDWYAGQAAPEAPTYTCPQHPPEATTASAPTWTQEMLDQVDHEAEQMGKKFGTPRMLGDEATTASASDVRMLVANIPLPEGSKQFQHGFVSAKEAMLAALPARAPAPSRNAAPLDKGELMHLFDCYGNARYNRLSNASELRDRFIAALTQQSAASALPPPELTWLYTHCRAIGMDCKSDSGQWEHDIALFTTNLVNAAQASHAGADTELPPRTCPTCGGTEFSLAGHGKPAVCLKC